MVWNLANYRPSNSFTDSNIICIPWTKCADSYFIQCLCLAFDRFWVISDITYFPVRLHNRKRFYTKPFCTSDKKSLLQRSTNSTTLNKIKRPGYPVSQTSSQKKTKQSIASNIQTTTHCTSKNTSHNFKVNVASSFSIENKYHASDMNLNSPAQPNDKEQSINPTPWCQPTECKSIDFLKKIPFDADYCSSCSQRILQK